MKRVLLEKPARQSLRKMQRPSALRIVEKIEQYAASPENLAGHVKALVGDHRKRLRVGDWRVLFVEDKTTSRVLDIRSRGSAYR
jgi:mRNA interferase RelE/StbE